MGGTMRRVRAGLRPAKTCKCALSRSRPAGDGNIDPGEQRESDTDCLLGCAACGGRDCLTREVGPVGPTCVDCQCGATGLR